MRLILLIGYSLLSIGARAQNQPLLKPGEKSFFKSFKENKTIQNVDHYGYKNGLSLYNIPLSKDQRVHVAKQDNMPCLMPDPTSIPFMPNAWTDITTRNFRDNMPNPIKPDSQ